MLSGLLKNGINSGYNPMPNTQPTDKGNVKKLVCFIFGHSPYTYNAGTPFDPEQAWACSYCHTRLEYGDEFWGLNINWKFTNFLVDLGKKKDNYNGEDLPF